MGLSHITIQGPDPCEEETMAETSKEQNQQKKQPAGAVRSDVTRTRLRSAALPAIAVSAIALTAIITFSARNNDTGTTPVSNEASSVRSGTKEQATPMRPLQDTTDRTPAATESVRDDGDGSTTQVTVNGESVTVPENGSYHRSTDDGRNKTDIHVDSRQHTSDSGDGSSGSSSSSSKVRINVQSNSTSESVSN